MNNQNIVATIPASLTDALIFVAEYCEEHKIKISPSGRVSCAKSMDQPDVMLYHYNKAYNDTRAELASIGFKKNIPKFAVGDLRGAFLLYVTEEQKKAKKRILAGLEYNGATSDGIDKWLTAMTGSVDPLDKYAIQHFLWQIKRKMYNKSVEYHLLPVLFGEQGGGKSKAIDKLVEPLVELRINFSPTEAMDERNYQALEDNFVCVFDEMSGIEQRKDVEKFKGVVSGITLTYRPLHTNTSKNVRQNCTFIGSSNKTVSQIISDPTGMRRVWQINCLPTEELSKNWALTNSIDTLALWRSIDENLDQGYGEAHRETLASAQKEAINKGEIPCFIEENNILPSKNEEDNAYAPIKDIYLQYKHWRKECWEDRNALTLQYLPAQLETLGLRRKAKTINGKRVVCFLVNKEYATKAHKIASGRIEPVVSNPVVALFKELKND